MSSIMSWNHFNFPFKIHGSVNDSSIYILLNKKQCTTEDVIIVRYRQAFLKLLTALCFIKGDIFIASKSYWLWRSIDNIWWWIYAHSHLLLISLNQYCLWSILYKSKFYLLCPPWHQISAFIQPRISFYGTFQICRAAFSQFIWEYTLVAIVCYSGK